MSIEETIKAELETYSQKNAFDSLSRTTITRLVRSMSKAFKLNDPSFDEARFLKACGVKPKPQSPAS